MTVHLVRHARAGRRSAWDGPDEERPISKAGRRQARDLAAHLADADLTRVLSSPYVRCIQTAEAIAETHGLTVEVVDALAEGVGAADVADLLADLDGDVVLCTHGDVGSLVLAQVRRDGVKLRAPRWEKGSVWALEAKKGRFVRATYRPPTDR